MATVKSYDTDRYGRTVGVLTVAGVNVNQNLIEAGYAWQYRKYCTEPFCRNWLQAEGRARSARIGLWSDTEPVPPWELRKGKRNTTSRKSTPEFGVYHGNVKSHVFHASSCRHFNCKNCVETFQSREAAISAGYRPGGPCEP